MNENLCARLLCASLDELRPARGHLAFSALSVAPLDGDRSEAALVKIDAYTARYARVVDLLTNKVLRAVFAYELEPAETMLDRLNLAEKRGFVATAGDLRNLIEHRRRIAHDYAGTQMETIFAFCRLTQAQLDAICDRVTAHAERLLAAHVKTLLPDQG